MTFFVSFERVWLHHTLTNKSKLFNKKTKGVFRLYFGWLQDTKTRRHLAETRSYELDNSCTSMWITNVAALKTESCHNPVHHKCTRGVQKLFSTTLSWGFRRPQVGFHSLGRRFPALDLVTGLIIWRRLVAVVLRWRVGSGTTSRRTRSRVGRPRVSSLFRPTRRVRFIATRRVLIWARRERQSSNQSNSTGSGLVRWRERVAADWPHRSRCSMSFVAASAAAAAVSWAWQTSAPPGCLGWTSRTAIKEPREPLVLTLLWSEFCHTKCEGHLECLKKNNTYYKDENSIFKVLIHIKSQIHDLLQSCECLLNISRSSDRLKVTCVQISNKIV